jgi:hypothetical protein
MTTIERPGRDECTEYYFHYVCRALEDDVLAELDEQFRALEGLLRGLTDEQAECRFAPGEWSIKEVIGHLVDAERIFAYRAFTLARDEAAVLPGFDPDVYIREAHYGAASLTELLDELASLRRANLIAFRRLTPEATRRRGIASDSPFSVRSLIYILAGHLNYHIADLQGQYLPGLAQR